MPNPAAAADDDLNQGPDSGIDPNADPNDGLDLNLDSDDDPDDDDPDGGAGDGTGTAEPTAAQLKAQLDAANARAKQAAATVARIRRQAAVAKSKARTPAGKPAATPPVPVATDADPLAGLTPELRAEVLAARAAKEAAETQLAEHQAAAKERDLHAAVNAALLEAGLKLPADADEKRKTLKRIFRTLDLSEVEIDSDGDLVGADDEIETLKDLMPNLFTPGAPDDANGTTPKPKAKINPGGGRQQPTGAGEQKYPSTAAWLVSPEYKRRNQFKPV